MTLVSYEIISNVVNEIESVDELNSKQAYIDQLQSIYNLTKDRSVYYTNSFSVRFCYSKNGSFSNTVLSLSELKKYDDLPFIVVLCSPKGTKMYLANSTFLKKISHSSKELRVDNIKGSFNGSDIVKDFDGIENHPKNFKELFEIHQNYSWEENLERLVEATNGIVPRKSRFEAESDFQIENLKYSPNRAVEFMASPEFNDLQSDLNKRTSRVSDYIAVASLIDNVNLRGRFIEKLITTDDMELVQTLVQALEDQKSMDLKSDQDLGDYSKEYKNFITKTDIKTKVLFLSSAPKAFNVDKLLSFLASNDSVYLFFIVGIEDGGRVKTQLTSVFNPEFIKTIRVQHHWAGRATRGEAQFSGKSLDELLNGEINPYEIDVDNATDWIQYLLDL